MIDINRIRKDFPILTRSIHGYPLAYLDNSATSQKPQVVIDALRDFYSHYNANVHRGVYTISEEASEAFELVRKKFRRFLSLGTDYEVIYTRNTTESINLVSLSYGGANLQEGDEILINPMEHHSNIVPWLMIAKKVGAKVVFSALTSDGLLDMTDFEQKLSSKTKIVAVTHVSNVLGSINPIKDIVERAHRVGAAVLVDAAQSVPHQKIQVPRIQPDFFVFSAHKMLGPFGVGILVARKELLESMEPVFGGGDMIREVTQGSASWNELPWKFEAGTPSVADVIATGVAIEYLEKIGLDTIADHEATLTRYSLEKFGSIPGLTILGPKDPKKRGGIISFSLAGIHPHDLSTVVDTLGVAIRAGHHCTQPLHTHLGLEASARASFYLYNTTEEIDRLVQGIYKAKEVFRV